CALRTTTTSRQPCRSNADTTWRPRNPLPPVMSTRFFETSMTVTSLRGHRALDHVAPHDKDIHVRAQEAIEGLPGSQYDGLVFVERRIQQDRHAADPFERFDEMPVPGIRTPADRLEAPGAVDMGHGRDDRSLVRSNRVDLQHERIGHRADEELVEGLLGDR